MLSEFLEYAFDTVAHIQTGFCLPGPFAKVWRPFYLVDTLVRCYRHSLGEVRDVAKPFTLHRTVCHRRDIPVQMSIVLRLTLFSRTHSLDKSSWEYLSSPLDRKLLAARAYTQLSLYTHCLAQCLACTRCSRNAG